MKPIIKWVGGKSQLLNDLLDRMPQDYNDYFEPFIGGVPYYLRYAQIMRT